VGAFGDEVILKSDFFKLTQPFRKLQLKFAVFKNNHFNRFLRQMLRPTRQVTKTNPFSKIFENHARQLGKAFNQMAGVSNPACAFLSSAPHENNWR